jgi:polyferredoxin
VEGRSATAPDTPAEPFVTQGSRDWAPKPVWKHIFRPRTIVYGVAWAAIGVALLVMLFIRPEIEMTVAAVRNPTFVTLSDGTIRNAYDIRLRNKHGEPRVFQVRLEDDSPLAVDLEGEDDLSITVPADSTHRVRAYVSAAPDLPAASTDRTDLRFWVADLLSEERAHADSLFFGKESFDERSNLGP